MPEVSINSEGVAVDGEGKPIMIDGEPVSIKDALPQSRVDEIVKSRLAKVKEQQRERIKTLEEEAKENPQLRKMLEDLKAEHEETKQALQDADQKSAQKVASQLKDLQTKNEELGSLLEREKALRIQDQVATSILSTAQQFVNPAEDIVPKLLRVHKREPVLDDSGKPRAGQFIDVFEVDVTSNGQTQKKSLAVKEAVEAMAADSRNQHYLKPSFRSGSGGTSFGKPSVRSLNDLPTDAQKAAFITEHGLEAFEKLVDSSRQQQQKQ